jgi:hypothetical protein
MSLAGTRESATDERAMSVGPNDRPTSPANAQPNLPLAYCYRLKFGVEMVSLFDDAAR